MIIPSKSQSYRRVDSSELSMDDIFSGVNRQSSE